MTRNVLFDYMKGFGIIAVIIGHLFPHTVVRHVIYSFHMPLFFFISGYFLNTEKPFIVSIFRDMKRLLCPLFFTILSITLFRIIMGEGLAAGGEGAFSIGPMWFLLALFWARVILRIFAQVCRNISVNVRLLLLLLIAVVLSALTYYLYRRLPHWHLYIVQGLNALQFVTFGYAISKVSCPNWLKITFIIAWIVALLVGGIDMVHCEYTCYPIDVLGGIGGTYVMFYICKGLEYLKFHKNSIILHLACSFISWCGAHSLLILCLHTFDLKALHSGIRIIGK